MPLPQKVFQEKLRMKLKALGYADIHEAITDLYYLKHLRHGQVAKFLECSSAYVAKVWGQIMRKHPEYKRIKHKPGPEKQNQSPVYKPAALKSYGAAYKGGGESPCLECWRKYRPKEQCALDCDALHKCQTDTIKCSGFQTGDDYSEFNQVRMRRG